MIRPARLAAAAVAAAVASSLALGLAAPANAAKPQRSGKPAVVKVVKADRRLAAEQTKVDREIARKDVALARVLTSKNLTKLAVADADAVRANVAADRGLLAGLDATLATAATLTDVRAVAAQVKEVRPEVYAAVLSTVRVADHLAAVAVANQAVLADLAAQADAKELEGFDVTEVRAALAEAEAANLVAADEAALAGDLALTLRATSTKADLEAVRAHLTAAGDALEVVEAQVQLAEDALALMVSQPVA